MVKVIVLFRGLGQRALYDEQFNQFLIMAEDLPGLQRKSVNTIFGGPGGPAPFQASVELFFADRPALEGALPSPEGIKAGAFLLEFAGSDALVMFAEVLEAVYHQGAD